MKSSKAIILGLMGLLVILFDCTEVYELKTENFESLLVVEATITDELKNQEIKLSKTFRLESDEPIEVSDARVWVETNSGIQYNFYATQSGIYTSETPFKAQNGEIYTLNVILSNGETFISSQETVPPASNIESLETDLINFDGEQGIQVYANSSMNGSNALYFKYDYEETYKVIAPYYNPLELKLVNVENENELIYNLELVARNEIVRECYKTLKSTQIIQTSLGDSPDNSVVKFPVRFIPADNSMLRDRYSILVKQSVQSVEAYNFYKILKELGTTENLFTSNQPGFIQGNMSSVTDIENKVIGFFQIASVSSKRIYFNATDFNLTTPPYEYDCLFEEDVDYFDQTSLDMDRNDYAYMFGVLSAGTYAYYSGEFPIFTLVQIECADCTSISSIIRPEFWED